MRHATIIIVSQSAIVVAGLCSILNRMHDLNATIKPVEPHKLTHEAAQLMPAMVIADPLTVDRQTVEELRATIGHEVRIVAVYHTALPKPTVTLFDESISIYDNAHTIENMIMRLLEDTTDNDEPKTLSQREKDVVVGIVKGLSNKEIAAEMNVSVNTVMTHRRNIASKLHIHSAAGLTIYAIVSKLVKLDEIKNTV